MRSSPKTISRPAAAAASGPRTPKATTSCSIPCLEPPVSRCSASRRRSPRARANRSLADYIAPAGDHLGGFAVTIHGAGGLAAKYEAGQDDYRAIMVKALADRLAEAFAEYIHLQARRDWFEP